MTDNIKENKEFNSSNFVLFLIQWRKPILIVTFISIVASIIFSSSFFITPLYKSTVIMFPTSSNAVSKALLGDNVGNKHDILEFGVEEQTEQMLQMLNSNKIRDRIIKKYHLMEHYGIPANSKFRNTKLYNEFENNIRFRRTEYMAVQIMVYDRDPAMAADLANDISNLLDTVKNEIQRERAIKGFKIVETEYNKLKAEVKQMEDSLSILRKLGVNDYETQAEMMNQQLAIELAKGNQAGIKRIQANIDNLATYGTAYVSLRDELEHEKKQLSLVKSKYEEAKIDAEQVLPQKFVVNSAFKAEKKAYPIRWIVVMVSAFSSLIMTILVIIIINHLKNSSILSLKKKGYFLKSILESKQVADKKEEKCIIESEQNIPPTNTESQKNENEIEKKEEAKKESTIKSSIKQSYTEVSSYFKNNNKNLSNVPNNMESYFNNLKLLKILIKWKWHLVAIALLTAVLSLFFSSPIFIKPRYKSSAIVYPSNIAPYSDETETEQMLQWMNSADIMDSVVKKYNLIAHYGVDVTKKEHYSLLTYLWTKNVSINKTQYASVKIDVNDIDPKMACSIVNAILDFYNLKIERIHKIKYDEVVAISKKQLDDKQKEIDSVENKLHELRTKYGIIDYGNQTHEVARGFLRTVDGNNSSRINTAEVLKLKENIEQKGGEFVIYNTRLYDLMREYSDLYTQYDKALKDSEKKFTYTNIVSSPIVADKKAYPKRILILLYSLAATLFFSVLVISIIENQKLNRKINL